ncbi:MAG: hypothetical protein MUW51_03100 [Lactococcus lactis]|nr:hypothetical protein [Lactococcus lactis]
MDLKQIESILRNSGSANNLLLKKEIETSKSKAIYRQDEELANKLWCLENINEIQFLFISAFNNLKKKNIIKRGLIFQILI